MIAKILISPDLQIRVWEIEKILAIDKLSRNHPDLLYLEDEQKLGVEQSKQIRQFLSLKPYSAKGRAVVVVSAQNLTPDAQNALLKTLEEPPEESMIILGVDQEDSLLPTILSRCQVIRIKELESAVKAKTDFAADIEKLINSSIEDRFGYIEKLEDKEGFLKALVEYYHTRLLRSTRNDDQEFAKKLLLAEEWAKANGNIRAILEYLMLNLPY